MKFPAPLWKKHAVRLSAFVRWGALSGFAFLFGSALAITRVPAEKMETRFAAIVDRLLEGRVDVSRIAWLFFPPSLEALGVNLSFPVSESMEVVIADPSLLVRFDLFAFLKNQDLSESEEIEISGSDMTILLKDRADRKKIEKGIFVRGGPSSALHPDIIIKVYDSDIFLSREINPERIAGPRFRLFHVEQGEIRYRESRLQIKGRGTLDIPGGAKGALPLELTFDQKEAHGSVFKFTAATPLGTGSGELDLDRTGKEWNASYTVGNFFPLCPYLFSKGCDVFPYSLSFSGGVTADLEWLTASYFAQYRVSVPVDRPIERIAFSGESSGTYIRHQARVNSLQVKAAGDLGNFVFQGDYDIQSQSSPGVLSLDIEHLNLYNGLLTGDGWIPPGHAVIHAKSVLHFSDMLESDMEGQLDFGGYRLSEVGQGKSLMRFLKITDEGVDEDELVFTKSQGIGVEIKSGSGGAFRLSGGKIYFSKFAVYTDTMNMFLTGDLDLRKNEYNAYLKFQGLRQVDKLLGYIPLFGIILDTRNESILNLNFQITGPFNAPTIKPVYRIPGLSF